MARQLSPTQKALDNLIFQPTRRSRNKTQPIPPASQVTTFDYVHGLLTRKFDRMRGRSAANTR
ncbi:NinE family protein [Pectobacterium brasiliense]|uniref:NinE family protein n=1 Tax=Pectobacterium brasiliense TaxID=180957 RepID=UPI000907C5E1|nr:NinE family protein [Pectobacterium brasiliense]MBN3186067.1 NinE family protein [Pectobacterium brasiliense]QHG26899.1 NinE family protein [Pectobacterium brasiliense]